MSAGGAAAPRGRDRGRSRWRRARRRRRARGGPRRGRGAAPGRLPDAGGRAGGGRGRAGRAARRGSADLGAVNLAAEVQDGRQILVPRRRAGRRRCAAGVAPEPAAGQPLNLNTATLEQLDTLSGVGPATAQKILDAREERGGFGSIEELGEIPGIGDARLATLREEATV